MANPVWLFCSKIAKLSALYAKINICALFFFKFCASKGMYFGQNFVPVRVGVQCLASLAACKSGLEIAVHLNYSTSTFQQNVFPTPLSHSHSVYTS